LFSPSDHLTGIWWDWDKCCNVCLLFGPRNPLVGYTINPEEALVGFVMSPTFMLRIWHGGDWLKKIFGSSQSMVGWYVAVPNLVGFAYVNKIYFPLVFYV